MGAGAQVNMLLTLYDKHLAFNLGEPERAPQLGDLKLLQRQKHD